MPIELILLSVVVAIISLIIRAFRGLSFFSYIVILLLSLFVPFAVAFVLVSFTLTSGVADEYYFYPFLLPLLPIAYALIAPVSSKYKRNPLKLFLAK